MRLENKAIFLIGGATGIGAAAAQRLMSEGAKLVVADIAVEKAKALARRAILRA